MVFALCLTSYLALCYTSARMSTRNLMGSHAIELAEAGIEFALYSETNGDWTGWTIAGNTAEITTANPLVVTKSSGFVLSSASPVPLNLGNGVTGQVTISITNYNTSSPTFSSTAYMSIPNEGNPVTRTITTSGIPAPVFASAVVATSGAVTFSSGGTLDSYDSRLGTYASQTPGYSAVVLSQNTSAQNTVVLKNAAVHGYAVGYDSGNPPTFSDWLSSGSSSFVVGPSTPGGTKIDSTRTITNPLPFQLFNKESMPVSLLLGEIPASTYYDSTPANQYVLEQGTLGNPNSTIPSVYQANSINVTSGTVVIQGPVVIITYGGVNISGTGQIAIQTPNGAVAPASLMVFLEYGSMTLGGNGIVNNDAVPMPKRVSIVSTTNQWGSVTVSTSQSFNGVIYFPYLPFAINSPDGTDLFGSFVGSSVTVANSPNIHYDVALRYPDSSTSDFAFEYLNAPMSLGQLVETAQ